MDIKNVNVALKIKEYKLAIATIDKQKEKELEKVAEKKQLLYKQLLEDVYSYFFDYVGQKYRKRIGKYSKNVDSKIEDVGQSYFTRKKTQKGDRTYFQAHLEDYREEKEMLPFFNRCISNYIEDYIDKEYKEKGNYVRYLKENSTLHVHDDLKLENKETKEQLKKRQFIEDICEEEIDNPKFRYIRRALLWDLDFQERTIEVDTHDLLLNKTERETCLEKYLVWIEYA